jgi:hypothetical protein
MSYAANKYKMIDWSDRTTIGNGKTPVLPPECVPDVGNDDRQVKYNGKKSEMIG